MMYEIKQNTEKKIVNACLLWALNDNYFEDEEGKFYMLTKIYSPSGKLISEKNLKIEEDSTAIMMISKEETQELGRYKFTTEFGEIGEEEEALYNTQYYKVV